MATLDPPCSLERRVGTGFMAAWIFPHFWGSPRRQGLCSHVGAQDGRGMQPLLILSPHWGPSTRQGLCSHPAHMWAPKTAGVRSPFLISFPRLALGTPETTCVL